MRIAFVLNDLRLSGGVNVVLQYASRMAAHAQHQITLVLRDPTPYPWADEFVTNLKLSGVSDTVESSFDIAVATYWDTILLLGNVPSSSYVWFCQLYEDRFFPDRNPSISSMQVAGAIPIPVVTEATWIKDLIRWENPDRAAALVLNGVDKKVFNVTQTTNRPAEGFSVLVEGPVDSASKGTALALQGSLASNKATEITHIGNTRFETHDPRYRFIRSNLSFSEMAEMYRRHHVLVKTPRAEGMFGPPLEAFHCGTPAVVTPVTGSEEYVVHMKNAIVVDWDSAESISRAIDEIGSEPNLWQQLSDGALETAKLWPDWDEQWGKFERSVIEVAAHSKLTQADLGNLGRTIDFADLMHWLAMRRLSDKDVGPILVETLWKKAHGTEAKKPPTFLTNLRHVIVSLRNLLGNRPT